MLEKPSPYWKSYPTGFTQQITWNYLHLKKFVIFYLLNQVVIHKIYYLLPKRVRSSWNAVWKEMVFNPNLYGGGQWAHGFLKSEITLKTPPIPTMCRPCKFLIFYVLSDAKKNLQKINYFCPKFARSVPLHGGGGHWAH